MALQDLTPQLRTRLSRMEKAVGWFMFVATALLLFGLGYYVYKTAETKGWFLKKVDYNTSISSGDGLKEGQPVRLMGFDVGEITRIEANRPDEYYNITVFFRIKPKYSGYVLTDSVAKVASGNFLGGRYLEITKGTLGVPTVLKTSDDTPTGILNQKFFKQRKTELAKRFPNESELYTELNNEAKSRPKEYYTNLGKASVYWIPPAEELALTERAQQLLSKVEAALPGFLALTNQLTAVLNNSAAMTSNLNEVAEAARPLATNLAVISANLKDSKGSLGEWLIPTNINAELGSTLHAANTNLVALAESLQKSLDNLASITSNLNNQVQVNTNILSNISAAVVHSDELIQGLKHHWMLRSAFKDTNAPPEKSGQPSGRATSPKAGK